MAIQPYALARDEGRIYEVYGLPFNIKAGRHETHDGLTFMEFVTRKARSLAGIPTTAKTRFSTCSKVRSSSGAAARPSA